MIMFYFRKLVLNPTLDAQVCFRLAAIDLYYKNQISSFFFDIPAFSELSFTDICSKNLLYTDLAPKNLGIIREVIVQ